MGLFRDIGMEMMRQSMPICQQAACLNRATTVFGGQHLCWACAVRLNEEDGCTLAGQTMDDGLDDPWGMAETEEEYQQQVADTDRADYAAWQHECHGYYQCGAGGVR